MYVSYRKLILSYELSTSLGAALYIQIVDDLTEEDMLSGDDTNITNFAKCY
jgi:hypothetical protein